MVFNTTIQTLFERGIQESDYAFHGTCIEATLYLAEHGRMPTTGFAPDELFFYTDDNKFFQQNKEHPEDNAFTSASAYAILTAQIQYLISCIPQISHADAWEYVAGGWFATDRIDELLYAKTISERDLIRIETEAKNRKGVIITLDQKIKCAYQILPGDLVDKTPNDAEDNKIITPGGLPIGYLTGIIGLGSFELNVLSGL